MLLTIRDQLYWPEVIYRTEVSCIGLRLKETNISKVSCIGLRLNVTFKSEVSCIGLRLKVTYNSRSAVLARG